MNPNKKRKLPLNESSTSSDEIEICETPKPSSIQAETDFKNYFSYEKSGNVKSGICKICCETGERVEIKMKKSNTTGLKRHLAIHHQQIYELIFGKPTAKAVSKTQRSLENFVFVSRVL